MDRIKHLVNERAKKDSRVIRFLLDTLGYGGHWTRRVMNSDINLFIKDLPVEKLTAAEISGHHFAHLPWQCYMAMEYPEFDICVDENLYSEKFDIVFCEQVLEHVWQPQKALRHLYKMLKSGGWLVISTPFLIKIHKCPEDFWRFSPDCMHRMLTETGFDVEKLKSWGNRSCVKANLKTGHWARYYPFSNLKNDPDLPVVVWSYARKTSKSE
jgi:SAM-dependent methyltransferase